ncbi:microsomal glutathione S-transferase 3-like [Pocillopora damicornis]|uniref:microsomal glutathione S-transferase 3-like n=1 Tax=Pocillopora damicornis TaxID=46731 RepID=UPI000F551B57|nr:microsomal glutathione S-transferase 3-like [Pocillopora damicornis]
MEEFLTLHISSTQYEIALVIQNTYLEILKQILHFKSFHFILYSRVEVYPQFLLFLLLGGLEHPVLTSAAGLVWIVSRFFYAHGYYTGDPEKRLRGSFGYLGFFTMLGCTVKLGLRLLGYF